jgi:hypothetical protein
MRFRSGALLILVLLLATATFAQIDTGIISGKVVDPSGAVVPGAQITVTQIETNTQSVGQTNEDGMFRVPSLKSGSYRINVTAAGFKGLTREGLILRIGENLAVDLRLEVGAVTESIEVVNQLPLLETQSSSTDR